MYSPISARHLPLAAILLSVSLSAQESIQLKNANDKASYGIGLNIGTTLKQQGFDLNTEALAAGINDALSGGKRLLSETELKEALAALQTEMLSRKKASAEAAKQEGEAFLAANKTKEGVETLPSGLQYKVTSTGQGPKPAATDTVTTHYRGTLIDGTEFDSSYSGGEPVSFPVNGVIAGWTEALQLMSVGSKWQLFIPSNLAYGERGQGPIPPNSALIFDIELLGIEGKN